MAQHQRWEWLTTDAPDRRARSFNGAVGSLIMGDE
jgi:hypothetical protein